ncbi:MAG: TIR domain-containing protein [Candidatus Methanoplasma sp.]|nr:TIR domain-containing protein [Candidatus Methanoplasma sp.]
MNNISGTKDGFLPPLSIVFIWDRENADTRIVTPIMKECCDVLSMDRESPFSRSMNVPIFTRVGPDSSDINYKSQCVILIPFVTDTMLVSDEWRTFMERNGQATGNQTRIVMPVGLCKGSSNMFEGVSDIKLIDSKKYSILYAALHILHGIYRAVLKLNGSNDNMYRVFISYTRRDPRGQAMAENIKKCIESAGRIGAFIDGECLLHGKSTNDSKDSLHDQFSREIEKSTLIAIHSNKYSSRHWCQIEIMHAKKKDRPMIAIDVADEYEDRRFPPASNIPCVYVRDITDEGGIRAVIASLVETMRCVYSQVCLTRYKDAGWFGSGSIVLKSRPPELSDLMPRNKKKKTFIYPDPPIFQEELEQFKQLGLTASTPLTFNGPAKLDGVRIGISASPGDDSDMISKSGQRAEALSFLSSSLAVYIMSLGSTLVYGGDFRKDSFAEPIFEEAHILKDRLARKGHIIHAYVSWPVYEGKNFDSDVSKWCGQAGVAKIIKCSMPSSYNNNNNAIGLNSPLDRQVHKECHGAMRNRMIHDCDCTISMGGKCQGYSGVMPGVLDEILIALNLKKPLFLIGGFGGITSSVCEAINGDAPSALSPSYHKKIVNCDQIVDNVDYTAIMERMKAVSIDGQDYNCSCDCLRNGLSAEENRALFETPFMDEAIYLVLKGLSNLKDNGSF